MDEKPELEGTSPNPPEEKVELTKAELQDLKHRADVSSQNFERLKKTEEENELLKAQLLDQNQVPSEIEDENRVKAELAELKSWKNRQEVLETYPILKESWSDFEQFRQEPDNKGMSLKTAAKSFLVEKGFLEPTRKGLEKPTGGTHAPISTDMKPEEIKNLREKNYRAYYDMVKKGQIKV